MKIKANKNDIIQKIRFKSGQTYYMYKSSKIDVYQAKKLIVGGIIKRTSKDGSRYKLTRNIELTLKK